MQCLCEQLKCHVLVRRAEFRQPRIQRQQGLGKVERPLLKVRPIHGARPVQGSCLPTVGEAFFLLLFSFFFFPFSFISFFPPPWEHLFPNPRPPDSFGVVDSPATGEIRG